MNLIKEMEGKLLDQIINEAKSPQDEAIKASITEWKLLQKKLAVVNKIAKAVTSRITELETGFEEVIKGIDGNKTVVDGAIIEYTQKKGNTTVKYKEAVDYALKMVNEAQKKVLEDFVKSVTKSGEIKNVLAVVDPDLEKFLIDLSSIDGTDMMDKIEDAARAGFDRLPKQVANAKKRVVKEGVGENIAKVVKNLVSKFKTVFRSVFKSIDKSKKAADAFASAVKANPLNEGLKAKFVDAPIGKDLKKALAIGGVKIASMDGEADNYDGDITVTMSNGDVVKYKYHYDGMGSGANVELQINKDKKVKISNDPHKHVEEISAAYKAHLSKAVKESKLDEAVGINKGIRSIVASIKAIDMESDSDSLDAAGLRLILKELEEKWNEPGVPGSDQSSEAKMVLKVSKMLEELIKFLPKPESND